MRSGNSNVPAANSGALPADNTVRSGIPGARVSRSVPVALPAATTLNGQVQPSETAITQAGNRFYVLGASAVVTIQPVRAGAVGAANQFGIGQGQPVVDGFDTLTVKNYSTGPVVALIWVGYDDFINDQLILANTTLQNVAYPTYQTPGSAAAVNIPDLSGTVFSDVNGKKWGAIARVSILFFNTDSGVTMLLQKSGTVIASGPAVGVVFPATAIRFDFGGNYAVNIGGAAINAVISEIYQAIPV